MQDKNSSRLINNVLEGGKSTQTKIELWKELKRSRVLHLADKHRCCQGHVWCVWSHCGNVNCPFYCPDFNLSFTALPIPPSLAILAFSVLPVHLRHSAQSLPLSTAGYREGEGKPSGADRALFQGAAGTGSLWQHQECRHSRPNVSRLC